MVLYPDYLASFPFGISDSDDYQDPGAMLVTPVAVGLVFLSALLHSAGTRARFRQASGDLRFVFRLTLAGGIGALARANREVFFRRAVEALAFFVSYLGSILPASLQHIPDPIWRRPMHRLGALAFRLRLWRSFDWSERPSRRGRGPEWLLSA